MMTADGSEIMRITVEDQEKNQLSLERVEALKLLTAKMKKVGKVPVLFENKFCSHVHPQDGADMINASELANADPHNKFTKRWEDKNHIGPHGQDFKDIPKHFYTNYKTNLIRDAHYMAKALVRNRSVSPAANPCVHQGKPGEGSHPENCPHCKPQNISTKHRFRSFTGGIKSRIRSKNVLKTAHLLHKPYRPCRRTCCAQHNPMFHHQRMQ